MTHTCRKLRAEAAFISRTTEKKCKHRDQKSPLCYRPLKDFKNWKLVLHDLYIDSLCSTTFSDSSFASTDELGTQLNDPFSDG